MKISRPYQITAALLLLVGVLTTYYATPKGVYEYSTAFYAGAAMIGIGVLTAFFGSLKQRRKEDTQNSMQPDH